MERHINKCIQLMLMLHLALLANGGELRKTIIYPLDTINKVSLTQRGYIQFLKYIADVPALNEFTFCTWMRSDNLTLPHSLLSYSANQIDRLVRVWVGDQGKSVSMTILEEPIFKIPVNIQEYHWNHFCSSWNSKTATWSFYFNGKLVQSGNNYKLHNVVIPEKGDLVVGQEYTDFNKGLDDGVEGDIFGFNLVSSATNAPKVATYRRQLYIPYADLANFNDKPLISHVPAASQDVPQVLGYFAPLASRKPKGFMDMGNNMLQHFYKLFNSKKVFYRVPLDHRYKQAPKFSGPIKRAYANGNGNSIADVDKTLGTFLVELSYGNCALGKGAPLADNRVIVSWTKTPVRVFGGAILKTVEPFCKKR